MRHHSNTPPPVIPYGTPATGATTRRLYHRILATTVIATLLLNGVILRVDLFQFTATLFFLETIAALAMLTAVLLARAASVHPVAGTLFFLIMLMIAGGTLFIEASTA